MITVIHVHVNHRQDIRYRVVRNPKLFRVAREIRPGLEKCKDPLAHTVEIRTNFRKPDLEPLLKNFVQPFLAKNARCLTGVAKERSATRVEMLLPSCTSAPLLCLGYLV